MKILITASTYPNEFDANQPFFVKDLAEKMKVKYPELDIFILIPHAPGVPFKKNENGLTIYSFKYFIESCETLTYPAIWPNLKKNPFLFILIPFLLFFQTLAVYKIVKRKNIDIIYSHWFMPQGLCCGLVALLLKKQHVLTSHSSDIKIMRKLPFFGPMIVRYFTRRMAHISVVSKRTHENLENFFSQQEWEIINRKVKILPMGVDCNAFRSSNLIIQKNLLLRYQCEGKKVIFFIGRLEEKKGIRYLLAAIKKMLAVNNNIMLIIAGDGSLNSELVKLTFDYGLDDYVKFIGYIHGDEKTSWYTLSDVLVIPSIITASGDAEGMPVVLMEGLASGSICVATNESGGKEIITDGVNGFLVPQKNGIELANVLLKVIGMSYQERYDMQNSALLLAKSLDWDAIATQHVEFLFQINKDADI